eukprot:gene129-129_t
MEEELIQQGIETEYEGLLSKGVFIPTVRHDLETILSKTNLSSDPLFRIKSYEDFLGPSAAKLNRNDGESRTVSRSTSGLRGDQGGNIEEAGEGVRDESEAVVLELVEEVSARRAPETTSVDPPLSVPPLASRPSPDGASEFRLEGYRSADVDEGSLPMVGAVELSQPSLSTSVTGVANFLPFHPIGLADDSSGAQDDDDVDVDMDVDGIDDIHDPSLVAEAVEEVGAVTLLSSGQCGSSTIKEEEARKTPVAAKDDEVSFTMSDDERSLGDKDNDEAGDEE